MKKSPAILFVATLLLVLVAFVQVIASQGHNGQDTAESELVAHAYADGDLTASFGSFPTLHPLVVHFPLVLLLLAAVAQLASFFVFGRELSWVTMVLLAGGFVGAVVAIYFVHPHTQQLPYRTQQVLEIHEKFASYTLWISGIAVVGKAVSHFFFNRKRVAEVVIALFVVAAATFVSLAGHYGSQLAYIEGVGAQGRYLEQHH
ncbi:DUF2231 domain-containing protein [Botryobacter ruber]|uniref:DUF2231 domain-containing protein n=1 Tax=Botryobacter ruber TaxID=2171629 RepID=UPI000E0A2451|nr:DUF2231 domain-containing protein [Botryobacter ruber]